MNTKQYQYVITLAKEESFSKAAAALNISQPSLSQYIRNIENELGTDLFFRKGGQPELTSAGELYINAGREILEIERNLKRKINDMRENRSGSITIGTSPFYSTSLIPYAIQKFKIIYPNAEITIKEFSTEKIFEAASHGEFDIGLTSAAVDPGLFASERIMDEEIVLAIPRCLPLPSAVTIPDRIFPAVDMADLCETDFITLDRNQAMQKHLESIFLRLGLKYRSAVQVRSIEAQLAMVKKGLGIALVPSTAREFEAGNSQIIYRSVLQKLPMREMHAFYNKSTYISSSLRDFLDVLRNLEPEKQ